MKRDMNKNKSVN